MKIIYIWECANKKVEYHWCSLPSATFSSFFSTFSCLLHIIFTNVMNKAGSTLTNVSHCYSKCCHKAFGYMPCPSGIDLFLWQKMNWGWNPVCSFVPLTTKWLLSPWQQFSDQRTLQHTSMAQGSRMSIFHCKALAFVHYVLGVCTSWKWHWIDGAVSLLYIVLAPVCSVKFTALPRNCNVSDGQSWTSYELNIRARP
jgi:hypothetical protein